MSEPESFGELVAGTLHVKPNQINCELRGPNELLRHLSLVYE
jgi:hypothetical protein